VKFGDPCQVAGVTLWGEQPLLAPPQVDEGRATALSAQFQLTPADAASRGSAPAETYLVNGGHRVSD
jgi:hypothetical protein